ncbi:MAG: response regulator, partial [Alphaproteobacteria bacterium]|nr:response regulator [Alphaproteobacteria bacterium]
YDQDDRLVLSNDTFAQHCPDLADLMIPGARFEDIVRAGLARGHYADAIGDPEAFVAERVRQHRNTEPVERRLRGGRWGLVSERRMRNGGIAGLRVDITRLKTAEAALRAREAELSRSQVHLNEAQRLGAIGSYERRIDGAWLWSRETYRLFGRDPDTFTVTDASVLAGIHPDDHARLLDERRRIVDGDDPRELEFRILQPDGRVRTVHNRATTIRDDAGQVVGTFGTLEDVTEKRQVERQLIQAQKMEAIGNLTGGVTHDFNNLLTVILGNSELLLATLEGPDAELVQECVLAARRGGALASQLLSFARRQVLQPSEIDVATLVPRAVTLMRRTLGEHIAIDVHLRAEPFVVADAVQLESALLNLAINARDAMPDGGRITLEVDATTLDAATAAHRELAPGPYVTIALRDTGTGMAPETLAKAFEPFFTTKEVGKGSGLGLSMVYGFAKQSGGHAAITSALGGGTTVQLWLPAAPRRLAASAAPAPAALPGRGETILVVEDNELVRAMVVRQLERLGYQVVEAVDGTAALALLAGRPAEHPIDLIFTDVVMPGGLSGFEVAERARAQRPGIRVLFTSGYSDHAVTAQGRFGPGACLLAKPYEPRELAHRLREILDTPQ